MSGTRRPITDSRNRTYWAYPTQSNSPPSNVLSATGTNNANFYNTSFTWPDPAGFSDPTNYLTPAGAFADSPGPYGTYDMGGDVFQWTEAAADGTARVLLGGSCYNSVDDLVSTFGGSDNSPADFADQSSLDGFRLVSLPTPEPSTWLLATIGAGGLWFARRQRR